MPILRCFGRNSMMKKITDFLRDEEGATAIEYGLIAGVIAVGILVSLQGVREAIIKLFDNVKDVLGTASTGGKT